jgi:hypothetical protein
MSFMSISLFPLIIESPFFPLTIRCLQPLHVNVKNLRIDHTAQKILKCGFALGRIESHDYIAIRQRLAYLLLSVARYTT